MGLCMNRNRYAWTAGALALAVAAPAVADVTITDANIAGNPEQNVLLSNDTTAMFIVGLTNQTNTPVVFTGEEDLVDPSNGQARIEAVDDAFDFLEITLQNPALAFTWLEFNLNSAYDGDVTITAIDNFGTEFAQILNLDDNGENRINIFATNNQYIKLVRIEAAGDLQDIRQVRIEGRNRDFGVTPNEIVPEPSTWALMILGFGAAGAMLRRRAVHA
jgi:hypothetical protein